MRQVAKNSRNFCFRSIRCSFQCYQKETCSLDLWRNIENYSGRKVHDLANQNTLLTGHPFQSTRLHNELHLLVNESKHLTKNEIVKFLEKAKKLLATSESFLSKEQLISVLDRVGQLGEILGTENVKSWSIPFWRAMSYQLALKARSYHVKDIAQIINVYSFVFSAKNVEHKDREFASVHDMNAKLYQKLLSVLDLRLRQSDGKEHLPLGEMEFLYMLSIFRSAAQLYSCKMTTPLINRLVLRMISEQLFWTEDHILEILAYLKDLSYVDQHGRFCTFVLNTLNNRELVNQHKLCRIVNGMGLIKPKYMSAQRVNTILSNALLLIDELKMDEVDELLHGLARMKIDIDVDLLEDIIEQFIKKSQTCTPTQLSSMIFNISKLPETSNKNAMCSAAATELTTRISSFRTKDIAKIMFGLCHLHFHPEEACLTRVMSHSMDILLEDDILQEIQTPTTVTEYEEIEHFKKMKGIEANTELDNLTKIHHSKNRSKVKRLKNVIAMDQHPEDPIYHRTKYENFKGEELASLIFGLAQMRVDTYGDKFFDFVKEEIVRDVIPFDAYELTFALWGLAICRHLDKRCLSFALHKIKVDRAANDEVIKIRIGKCLLTLRSLSGPEENIEFESDPFLFECYQTWLRHESSPSLISPIILDAVNVLQKSGFDCQLRCKLKGGTCVADILKQVNGQTFALEVRPVSFSNVGYQIPGESQWRVHLLDIAGCTVLYIDSKVWTRFRQTEKREYLKRLTGIV